MVADGVLERWLPGDVGSWLWGNCVPVGDVDLCCGFLDVLVGEEVIGLRCGGRWF
jgi:hypothetical protein